MLDNFVQVQGARIGASNASKVTGFERAEGAPPRGGETLKFQKFAEHPVIFFRSPPPPPSCCLACYSILTG